MKIECSNCKIIFNRKKSAVIKCKKIYCCNKCRKEDMKGIIPWNKGRNDLPKHSEQEKIKIGIGVVTSNKFWEGIKNRPLPSKQSILKRIQTLKKYELLAGKNNPRYNNGISYMERKLKKEIKNCEKCNIDFSLLPSERYINIHHIDKDRTNNKRENLLLICIKCHVNVHKHLGDRRGRFSRSKISSSEKINQISLENY